MNKSWAASTLLLMLLTTGCAVEPFTREPLPALKDPNPLAMRDSFSHTVSSHFDSDDTIVIEAPFNHDLEVLGVLRVDRPAGTFELIGLNPLAVKFFDISSDRQGATIRYAIAPLLAHREILLSIAQDIRRMYFDLTPPDTATTDAEPTVIRFSEKTPDGTLIYEFGGDPAVLLEKRLEGFLGAVWRVQYFQYTPDGTSLYPHGIVMDNSRFHYRIIVKNRDRTKD